MTYKFKLALTLFVALLLLSCNDETVTPEVVAPIIQDENATDSFRMGNEEIRGDIIRALLAEEIEHWENEDGSIGFYARDAERVDAIGFFAIGAYAARQ